MIPNFLATGGMHHLARSYPTHVHPFWEIVLYAKGEGVVTVGRRRIRFRPGTIVCTPPRTPHSEMSDEGFQNSWIAIEKLQADVDVPVVHLSTEHPIFAIVSIIHLESHMRKPTSDMVVSNLFSTFMVYLNEHLTNDPKERLVNRVKLRFIANVQNPGFQVADALDEVPLSRDHIRRLFKARSGQTPIRYLTTLRMERAKELLQIGLGIKEVADRVGLHDQYYFSRLFKKTQGVNPSEFRRTMP